MFLWLSGAGFNRRGIISAKTNEMHQFRPSDRKQNSLDADLNAKSVDPVTV
jgi:hypothetical protein